MTRRRLPLGMQTFREVRKAECYYVDKTAYLRRLVGEGKHYFLSRPRRFGKSLLLDTIKELFEGNQLLFDGLEIRDHWDWSVRHPVLRLDFGAGSYQEPGGLHEDVMAQLDDAAEMAGVASRYDTAPVRFRHLIRALQRQAGHPVVVLVDEYDKPILDALETPEMARANRDYLRSLYAAIKSSDADVRFTFLTGVSRSPQPGSARGNPSQEKASKVSLFSGLNNLKDITLDPRYSAICGYTDADLDAVFAPELPGLDRDRIRDWYNGYGWLGEERVYNPYDILLLFDSRRFDAWWFETGTPTFLVQTLCKRQVSSPALGELTASSDLLSAFDVDAIGTEALLFQTGYLTIQDVENLGGEFLYRLGYPNREVRVSLNRSLLRHLVQGAALLRRGLFRLFIGVRARGRSLFGSLCAGTAPTRLFSGSQPGLITAPGRFGLSPPARPPGHSRGVLVRCSWGRETPLRWPWRRRDSRDVPSACKR